MAVPSIIFFRCSHILTVFACSLFFGFWFPRAIARFGYLPVPVLRLDVVGEGLGLDVRGVVVTVVVAVVVVIC